MESSEGCWPNALKRISMKKASHIFFIRGILLLFFVIPLYFNNTVLLSYVIKKPDKYTQIPKSAILV